MGKKHDKEKVDSRKINVEIAPGNQQAMDVYVESYNQRPDRTTPKIGYTDVVNDALDKFLNAHGPRQGAKGTGGRK
jgi:hypothetical protein